MASAHSWRMDCVRVRGTMPSKAHEVLASRPDEVIRRWRSTVEGTLAPVAMARGELVDALPTFVREIIAALRDDAGLPALDALPEGSRTAAEHGQQRLRLGFSLDAVVREYGALHDAVMATATGGGAEVTVREQRVIFDCVITGIAKAVTQYVQERDVELVRQANEHFAFVAHELRNPLSSSLSALRLIQMKREIPADSRFLGALERGLLRATELIEQTLRTVRISSGVELRRESTTLRELLDDALAASASEAEAKGVSLRLVVENDRAFDVDVRLLGSALGNLVHNAVKYTPHGGVELRGTIANGRACIEVEDACGGLPPGKVERAFAPFVRMDDRQSGFGLGLAIAKQAVDAHGGTIRVQNLPGKGCIFALEVPIPG